MMRQREDKMTRNPFSTDKSLRRFLARHIRAARSMLKATGYATDYGNVSMLLGHEGLQSQAMLKGQPVVAEQFRLLRKYANYLGRAA